MKNRTNNILLRLTLSLLCVALTTSLFAGILEIRQRQVYSVEERKHVNKWISYRAINLISSENVIEFQSVTDRYIDACFDFNDTLQCDVPNSTLPKLFHAPESNLCLPAHKQSTLSTPTYLREQTARTWKWGGDYPPHGSTCKLFGGVGVTGPHGNYKTLTVSGPTFIYTVSDDAED